MTRFPTVKSPDSFDFKAVPSLNKDLVLADCDQHFHKTAACLGPSRHHLETGEFRDGQTKSYFDDERHFHDGLREVFS